MSSAAIALAPPGRLRSLSLLVGKEVRDCWRNRWFLLFAVAFTLLALGLCWLSVAGWRASRAPATRASGGRPEAS
jgi:hypothetical protein